MSDVSRSSVQSHAKHPGRRCSQHGGSAWGQRACCFPITGHGMSYQLVQYVLNYVNVHQGGYSFTCLAEWTLIKRPLQGWSLWTLRPKILVSQECCSQTGKQLQPKLIITLVILRRFLQFFLHTSAFSQPTTFLCLCWVWRMTQTQLYILVFVSEADLSEGDGPTFPHLRLQTPCHHSSPPLHQPGSHQGTSNLLNNILDWQHWCFK